MTPFGFLTISVSVGSTLLGLGVGIFANHIGDAALAWISGGCAFGPMCMIFGRVWAKADMRDAAKRRCAECDCDNPPLGCNWIARRAEPRQCATCHAILAEGPQPASTYEVVR